VEIYIQTVKGGGKTSWVKNADKGNDHSVNKKDVRQKKKGIAAGKRKGKGTMARSSSPV